MTEKDNARHYGLIDWPFSFEALGENARLAAQTFVCEPTVGIPSLAMHTMSHRHMERMAGTPEGSYPADPERVYLQAQLNVGTCMIDQWIPDNPMTMGQEGFASGTTRTASTGAAEVIVDGVRIDSPEAVCEHIEKVALPRLRQQIAAFDPVPLRQAMLEREHRTQRLLGPNILKGGYDNVRLPVVHYGRYGYENYFMAWALYPEVVERCLALEGDLTALNNAVAAELYREGRLPPVYRLDHDLADSRGTLASLESMERMYLPHLAKCLAPLANSPVRLLWHCDGNLMGLLPGLIECGVSGFQGFQYEDGMDYVKISRMTDRQGREPIIMAGVTVTRTLPFGTPQDVRNQLKFLVENGPKTGLFLGLSSSITPGSVSWENMQALLDGLAYYRKHGRE
jgi:uroporphyrinogen decarboxylase